MQPSAGSVTMRPMAVTRTNDPSRPGDRWRQALQAYAVPLQIAEHAPEPTFTLEPHMFRWRPDEDAKQPVRPSRRRALEALPEGGSVLDVGVGGGASSLGLAPKVGLLTGVDPLPGMLEVFERTAAEVGVPARAVLGSWPEAAARVDPADVVVCHHAIYGVTEIETFVEALTARSRRRVVIEVSTQPPTSGLNPLWRAIHGIERPDRAVADQLQAVLHELGLAVEREDIVLPGLRQEVTPERVAFARRRLYVGPDRDAEIAALLEAREPQEHRVAALWWPGSAA